MSLNCEGDASSLIFWSFAGGNGISSSERAFEETTSSSASFLFVVEGKGISWRSDSPELHVSSTERRVEIAVVGVAVFIVDDVSVDDDDDCSFFAK